MPFSGFEDFDDCLATMTEEEGHDMQSAENICGALQAEAKADHGNVEELRESLRDGAGLIADIGVDLVSGVDVPAIDSKWVMFKSDDDAHDYRVTSRIVTKDGDDPEKRIAYGAAMIPREPDKEGDVVATPTVEKAAHGFLLEGGGVDTDHSLIDGEGEVVESWVLKEAREFELPTGGTETYPAGTWMTGIKWGADAWERIQQGELTGLSIYGRAEHVDLQKSETDTQKDLTVPFADEVVVDLVYGAEVAAEKAAEAMGMDAVAHEHTLDDTTVWMPGPDHETYVETYNELAGADAPDASTDDIDAQAAKDEDPCWEGYTMVGTDENGDPRCVPDDDVPDAEFENAVALSDGPPAAEDGGTPKNDSGESDAQAPTMTDSDPDGGTDDGDGPTLKDVVERVDSLADTVDTLKADIDDAADADNVEVVLEDAAERLAAMDAFDDSTTDDVLAELQAAVDSKENDGDSMDDDEMDDEDDEMEQAADDATDKSDDEESDPNFGKGYGTGSDTAATAKGATDATAGATDLYDGAVEAETQTGDNA